MVAIEANDITVEYEERGHPSNPAIILIRGLGTQLIDWPKAFINGLVDQGFRVIYHDNRDVGLSSKFEEAGIPNIVEAFAKANAGEKVQPPYTMNDMALDVIGLQDALEIQAAHIVGMSMGGMIGQGIAIHHANRLESLVLADTAAIIPDDAQAVWQERIDAVRNQGMQAVAESTLERWFTSNYLKQNLPEIEQIRQQILATPVAGYIGCSEAIRRLNYLDQLSAIRIPTLIMVGADDPGTPVEASEAMQAHIQGSKLVVIPEAAHLSNIEQREVFNSSLMAHLQRLPS